VRREAFLARYGVEMSDDNVWLNGRSMEVSSLKNILLAIRSIDDAEAVRGSGSPRRTNSFTNEEAT
jgi:hypothetical protein